MLWGSVDAYNAIEFFNGTTLVDTVTGSNVATNPNGNQGIGNSFYVDINFTGTGYTSVVFLSTSAAFEFDNVAYASTTIPANSTGGTPQTLIPIDTTTHHPLCFLAGTRIATPDGEAGVEGLRRGNLVVTDDGHARPVRWVGVRTVSTLFSGPWELMPIRIRAGALAHNVPTRDLLVSPNHALFIGGVLAEAAARSDGFLMEFASAA